MQRRGSFKVLQPKSGNGVGVGEGEHGTLIKQEIKLPPKLGYPTLLFQVTALSSERLRTNPESHKSLTTEPGFKSLSLSPRVFFPRLARDFSVKTPQSPPTSPICPTLPWVEKGREQSSKSRQRGIALLGRQQYLTLFGG